MASLEEMAFIACQLIRSMESSTKHDDLRIPSVATVRRGCDPVPMHAWLPPLLESFDMDNGCSRFFAPVRDPIGRDTTPQAGTSARRNAPAHPRAVAGARDRRRTSARIAATTYSLAASDSAARQTCGRTPFPSSGHGSPWIIRFARDCSILLDCTGEV